MTTRLCSEQGCFLASLKQVYLVIMHNIQLQPLYQSLAQFHVQYDRSTHATQYYALSSLPVAHHVWQVFCIQGPVVHARSNTIATTPGI